LFLHDVVNEAISRANQERTLWLGTAPWIARVLQPLEELMRKHSLLLWWTTLEPGFDILAAETTALEHDHPLNTDARPMVQVEWSLGKISRFFKNILKAMRRSLRLALCIQHGRARCSGVSRPETSSQSHWFSRLARIFLIFGTESPVR
jgi:hypothetical protein